MGLDMYMYKTKLEEVAYWRKANAIHGWLSDHLSANGIENCVNYEISQDQLIELRDVCNTVINASKLVKGKIQNGSRYVDGKWVPIYEDGLTIEDSSVAEELLPVTNGFFYGSSCYDQYYIEDLKSTVEQINNILETTDFDTETIVYSAWW